MNIMEYSNEVCKYIDSLSVEDFQALLIEAGIERCPYEDEYNQ